MQIEATLGDECAERRRILSKARQFLRSTRARWPTRVRRSYLVEIQPVDYCYSLGNRFDFLYSSWVILTPYIRVCSAGLQRIRE
jgi:hypothetical protein